MALRPRVDILDFCCVTEHRILACESLAHAISLCKRLRSLTLNRMYLSPKIVASLPKRLDEINLLRVHIVDRSSWKAVVAYFKNLRGVEKLNITRYAHGYDRFSCIPNEFYEQSKETLKIVSWPVGGEQIEISVLISIFNGNEIADEPAFPGIQPKLHLHPRWK